MVVSSVNYVIWSQWAKTHKVTGGPLSQRTVQSESKRQSGLKPVACLVLLEQTYLWNQSQAGSDTRRTSSLTPPAWQTVALPGGSLAAVGLNTITPLQAAWPKRAHLHMWANANGQRIVRGISSTFGQLGQSQTKYYTGNVALYRQPGGLAWQRQEGHTSKTQIKAYRAWGKGWGAGQHLYRLSNQNLHALRNYHPYDLFIKLIKDSSSFVLSARHRINI